MLSPMVAIRNDQSPAWQAARSHVRRIFDSTPDPVEAPLAGVVGDFADAVRQADSFPEAVQVAVGAVRERAGADFIALLHKRDDTYESADMRIPGHGLLLNRLRNYGHPLAFSETDWTALTRWAQQFRPERLEEIERLVARGSGSRCPSASSTTSWACCSSADRATATDSAGPTSRFSTPPPTCSH